MPEANVENEAQALLTESSQPLHVHYTHFRYTAEFFQRLETRIWIFKHTQVWDPLLCPDWITCRYCISFPEETIHLRWSKSRGSIEVFLTEEQVGKGTSKGHGGTQSSNSRKPGRPCSPEGKGRQWLYHSPGRLGWMWATRKGSHGQLQCSVRREAGETIPTAFCFSPPTSCLTITLVNPRSKGDWAV